ncbi:MAG TPA: T9SS type A sorting domain-containing protein, partial [Saprospiraceae bacterium]|nr:T9SS type A sorting domain-containing protein [Saprospiraceae bacterium]
PAAGKATLSIYTVDGKVVKTIQGDFAQGMNNVVINRSEISAAGVLYYQLDTDTDSAVRKMIIIE